MLARFLVRILPLSIFDGGYVSLANCKKTTERHNNGNEDAVATDQVHKTKRNNNLSLRRSSSTIKEQPILASRAISPPSLNAFLVSSFLSIPIYGSLGTGSICNIQSR
eukprot:scaffold22759_cov54-Attheya_sp.AAC.1